MKTISDRIKELRKSLDLSQKEFSASINVSRGYLAQIECSDITVNDRIIMLICNEFGVREAWLRDGEEPMYPDINLAMEKLFAEYFLRITQAFSPVYTAYGEMMPLFENPDIVRMFVYLAYRLKRGGATPKHVGALKQMFDTAFPGYEEVVIKLESESALQRAGMESSAIARRLMPEECPE